MGVRLGCSRKETLLPAASGPVPGVIATSDSVCTWLASTELICSLSPGPSRPQKNITKEGRCLKIKYWYQKKGDFVIPGVNSPKPQRLGRC